MESKTTFLLNRKTVKGTFVERNDEGCVFYIKGFDLLVTFESQFEGMLNKVVNITYFTGKIYKQNLDTGKKYIIPDPENYRLIEYSTVRSNRLHFKYPMILNKMSMCVKIIKIENAIKN